MYNGESVKIMKEVEMKKLVGIVLFIAVCGSLIAGCEDQTGTKQDTRKQDNKTIIVGTEGNIPGWVQTDTKNAVSGYDCEIWSEIGKRTGYEIRQEVLESDELKEQLSDGTIDSIEGTYSRFRLCERCVLLRSLCI